MKEPTEKGFASSQPQDSGSPKKGFIGLFAGLELPNLIQMLAMNGFTGKVELRCSGKAGEIFLRGGNIVHAQVGNVAGAKAFEELLGWVEGEVLLDAERRPAMETIDVPWHALLIQAMARIEDRKAAPPQSQEPASPKGQAQASELLRLRGFHRVMLDRPGVGNCLVGKAGEVLCPAQPVPKLLSWFRIMWEVLGAARQMAPPDSGGQPLMLSLVLEGRNWLLASLGGDLVAAVEVEKGIDIVGLRREMILHWEQG
ncbi:MAG: DUF4388 domain-containing protein [bacterium]